MSNTLENNITYLLRRTDTLHDRLCDLEAHSPAAPTATITQLTEQVTQLTIQRDALHETLEAHQLQSKDLADELLDKTLQLTHYNDHRNELISAKERQGRLLAKIADILDETDHSPENLIAAVTCARTDQDRLVHLINTALVIHNARKDHPNA